MDTPDSKAFHRLIRRNKHEPKDANSKVIKNENEEEVMNPEEQSRIFADYYEKLAVPSNEEHYDEDYLEESKYRLDRSISPNKLSLFNNIMQTGEIPKVFKTGILTPVHRKGKDSTLPTNYRGITVTSALGKVFEYALLDKMLDLNSNQSDLQFGFTQGLSPIMAALIVSEGTVHAKQQNLNMFLATLDSQKAFDVVHHMILMEKLFYKLPADIWRVVQDLYSNMSSTIKWNSHLSKQFSINQRVRQGGVLSTHLYKLYINELPEELERRWLGLNTGLEYCGSPLCADDIVLMTTDETEIQAMLNIAYKFSCQHRYNIHPGKSTLIKTERIKTSKQQHPITLGEKPIKEDQQTTHLGIIRASKNETKLNIQEHVSVARRTLYTLIPVGLNGQEGLNPITAYKIYQAYVLPRLLYGLEVSLNATQMSDLKQFHLKTLRCFQSLPIRTSSAAVYMLLGAFPIEAELHKIQLSLLYSILASENTKLKNVMERQMTVNAGNSDSFFSRAQEILNFYYLPSIAEFKEHLPYKSVGKKILTGALLISGQTSYIKKWKKNPH
ncbi:unnamed protein product [Mytilus coruscus]|uniref:Reverse transcriptase domain-containing protein n=1 Tax=Mytilus coruscus TaxID=42192 RepID=A0A6J8A8U5_MYTCO|nr:unnamed protein product [Mytilus coruscus]